MVFYGDQREEQGERKKGCLKREFQKEFIFAIFLLSICRYLILTHFFLDFSPNILTEKEREKQEVQKKKNCKNFFFLSYCRFSDVTSGLYGRIQRDFLVVYGIRFTHIIYVMYTYICSGWSLGQLKRGAQRFEKMRKKGRINIFDRNIPQNIDVLSLNLMMKNIQDAF